MAEKWAFKAFPLMHSRELLFVQITDDGEEMLSEFRFANYWYLNNLFYMSAKIAGCENISGGTAYVQAVSKAVTQMYELVFPNDDMGFEDLKRMCVEHRTRLRSHPVIRPHMTKTDARDCDAGLMIFVYQKGPFIFEQSFFLLAFYLSKYFSNCTVALLRP